MSTPRPDESFERFTRRSDLAMTLLGIAWIPVLELPLLTNVPASMNTTFFVLDSIVWALFILEYLIKLYLAPSRAHFVRTHLVELLVIALPLLRPLRVLRVLNLLSSARVGTLFWSVYTRTRQDRWRRRLSLGAVALVGVVAVSVATSLAL